MESTPSSPRPSILACECLDPPVVDVESGEPPGFAGDVAAVAELAAVDETVAAAVVLVAVVLVVVGAAEQAAADESAAIVSADECGVFVVADEAVEDEGDKLHGAEYWSPSQSLPIIRPSFGL